MFDRFKGSANSFKEQLTGRLGRGLSAMEMVAVELKGWGAYVARNLSFQGTRFVVQQVNLQGEANALYDRCSELWRRFIELLHRDAEPGTVHWCFSIFSSITIDTYDMINTIINLDCLSQQQKRHR